MTPGTYDELRNIYRNGPVFPGDTISHKTAGECGRRRWARRNSDSDWVITMRGRLAYLLRCVVTGGKPWRN